MSKLDNSYNNSIKFTALTDSKVKAVETHLIYQIQRSRSTRSKAIVDVDPTEIVNVISQIIF